MAISQHIDIALQNIPKLSEEDKSTLLESSSKMTHIQQVTLLQALKMHPEDAEVLSAFARELKEADSNQEVLSLLTNTLQRLT
jgi:hypothetical protein